MRDPQKVRNRKMGQSKRIRKRKKILLEIVVVIVVLTNIKFLLF